MDSGKSKPTMARLADTTQAIVTETARVAKALKDTAMAQAQKAALSVAAGIKTAGKEIEKLGGQRRRTRRHLHRSAGKKRSRHT